MASPKSTVAVAEAWVFLADHRRKDPIFSSVSGSVVAIEKATQFFGMRVKIEDECGLISGREDLSLDMVDSRRDCLRRSFPGTIRVYSCNLCPRVAVNDSIRIDHRDNFEGVAIEKVGVFPFCI